MLFLKQTASAFFEGVGWAWNLCKSSASIIIKVISLAEFLCKWKFSSTKRSSEGFLFTGCFSFLVTGRSFLVVSGVVLCCDCSSSPFTCLFDEITNCCRVIDDVGDPSPWWGNMEECPLCNH
jgi:hypothetical protein